MNVGITTEGKIGGLTLFCIGRFIGKVEVLINCGIKIGWVRIIFIRVVNWKDCDEIFCGRVIDWVICNWFFIGIELELINFKDWKSFTAKFIGVGLLLLSFWYLVWFNCFLFFIFF